MLAIPIGLLLLGQAARRSNDERDAGITWLWAMSPRTMQSYLVRASVNDSDSTVTFRLEDDTTHEFTGCRPPDGPDLVATCTDQLGLSWDLNR